MARYILIILGIVILYKLIFDFIIPVYRTSREIRRKFKDMNQQMQDKMNQFQQANQQQPGAQPQHQQEKKKAGADKDYIDFEEINE